MNTEQQKHKYSCYKYTIWYDTDNNYWLYAIHTDCHYQGDIECDEYHDTREDAIKAAEDHIDKLENGPDEPDYDAPTAHETYMKAHDDRQKLRGY